MNFAVVTLLALLLGSPALLGLAEGSLNPDEAGVRVLLAAGVAIVIEGLVRRFVVAVRPVEAPAPEPVAAQPAED